MVPPNPANSDNRLDSIEACRGIAALLVLLYHASAFVQAPGYFAYRPLWGVFDWGFAGIDFFFVLSGFIILWANRHLVGQPHAAPRYLRKRFLRIYPLYWLLTLPIILAYFVLPISRQGMETDLLAIVGSLTLFPIEPFPHLPVAWTLTYEMMFYVLFAALLLHARAGLALLVVWQMATLGHYLAGLSSPVSDVLLNPRNLQFGLGMLTALAVSRGRVPAPVVCAATGAVLLVSLGLAWVALGATSRPLWWFAFALSAALLVAGLAAAERRHGFRTPASLLLLGAASYSIYLLHYPVELVVVRGFKAAESWFAMSPFVIFVTAAVLALGGGLALHLLVEKPLLRRLRGGWTAAPG